MDCTPTNVNLIKDSNCKNSIELILKFYGIDCVEKHTLNLRKLKLLQTWWSKNETSQLQIPTNWQEVWDSCYKSKFRQMPTVTLAEQFVYVEKEWNSLAPASDSQNTMLQAREATVQTSDLYHQSNAAHSATATEFTLTSRVNDGNALTSHNDEHQSSEEGEESRDQISTVSHDVGRNRNRDEEEQVNEATEGTPKLIVSEKTTPHERIENVWSSNAVETIEIDNGSNISQTTTEEARLERMFNSQLKFNETLINKISQIGENRRGMNENDFKDYRNRKGSLEKEVATWFKDNHYLHNPHGYVIHSHNFMTIHELFKSTINFAMKYDNISEKEWETLFMSLITEPTTKNIKNSNNWKLNCLNHESVKKLYQEAGLKASREEWNLIHLLLAYHLQAENRDEKHKLFNYQSTPEFARHEKESWQDWMERIETLLINTQFADLPFDKMVELCEKNKKLFADYERIIERIEDMKTTRQQMLKGLIRENGKFQDYIVLVQLPKNMDHTFVNVKYLRKFFDYMTSWNDDSGEQEMSEEEQYHWQKIHYERLRGQNPEFLPKRALKSRIDMGPRFTLQQTATVLDQIYYDRVNASIQHEECLHLPKQLIITADDKARTSGNTLGKENRKKREINYVHMNNDNESKSTHRKRDSPIPQELFEQIKEICPHIYKDVSCKYKGCRVKDKAKTRHPTYLCYGLWNHDRDYAMEGIQTAIEEFNDDNNITQFKDNLCRSEASRNPNNDNQHSTLDCSQN